MSKNLVQPIDNTQTAQTTTADSRTQDPLFKALQVSGSHKGSKYNLGRGDRANGFYFLYKGLEVPFKALFNENNKTNGILGVAFGTAKDCPSRSLGLCQLPSDRLCYARSGEARATKRDNKSGDRGMDSYFNGLLCSAFWDAFETSADIRNSLISYLELKGVDTLRFNLKSDFRHSLDIVAIYHLAQAGFNMTGYTARDDLAEFLERLGNHPNIILNGSNRKYTNRFKAVDSIEEYMTAKNKCVGDCSACRNCYRLRGETITVLIHGSGSDTALNNEANRKFILNWSANCLNFDWLRDTDFNTAKGFVTCINKELKRLGVMLRFKDIKDLMKFISKTGGI